MLGKERSGKLQFVCTALRAGYQILALDGVGTGLEASFTPGLITDTIIFHGLQFGLEYRR